MFWDYFEYCFKRTTENLQNITLILFMILCYFMQYDFRESYTFEKIFVHSFKNSWKPRITDGVSPVALICAQGVTVAAHMRADN